MTDWAQQFERLYAEHFRAVLAFALGRADPETAKDATAETFLAAWRSLDTLPAQPRAWLLTVVRRRIVDEHRSSARRDALTASLRNPPANVSTDLGEIVAEHERVRTAFAGLPSTDQELLRLLAWDGLTAQEAAAVLGCNPIQFRVRLHRARRRLRGALDDEDQDRHQGVDVVRAVVPPTPSRSETVQ